MLSKAIQSEAEIALLKSHFLKTGRVRDYALFSLGINAGLNISRLLSLKWADVFDFSSGKFFEAFEAKNKSNGRVQKIVLNESSKNALEKLLESKNEFPLPKNFIFESRNGGSISRFRAFQIIKRACEECGVAGNIGCESMKKTLAFHKEKIFEKMNL